ncbi:TetR/AcrR family transcriptional regulator [Nocardiopsis lambiniae]|uniref:TetR family transcriptional regulator C-terminal domain-containing protein n=1 Tax=Nocardiopsis lambiniae TaxID=3075539 RepID=A0ABU2MEE6_9ACTN|nr:TetR family transcriptional regulator C-terminal domain-containing protein [Nocardiopsis sp. DSM 44743]MDT0330910.1 TetR family transcriptional regulator C-terminal domain-containing protein [Nocardiopsis sp. DSM 44743]
MSRTRDRALDAAITLLGTGGVHALTHGKVDAAAGLPKGSTSNHFRTRDALIIGVVERLEELDRRDWARTHTPDEPTVDHLIDALARFVGAAVTTDRIRTVARYALSVEATHDPRIAAALARGAAAIQEWGGRILDHLGADDPQSASRSLMAYVDGLILRGVTRPEVLEPRERMAAVVRACLS